jgi:hypothetical protein
VFFFQNSATGTWITTKSVVDNTIQKFLTEKNLHFFTFYKKADKPAIKKLSGICLAVFLQRTSLWLSRRQTMTSSV